MARSQTKPTAPPADAEMPTSAQPAPVVTAYKGFDRNFACRGHQFEIGQTYAVSGRIRACANGFHACENPWDVLSYYPIYESRFGVVELSGDLDRHDEDSKIAAASITVRAELRLPEFVQRLVDWTIEATKTAIAAIVETNNEDGARIGSSGYGAQIGSSGYGARIGSSGYGAQIGSSGNGAQIGSSGNGAQIGSSGNDARIGSSGYGARIGSSGYGAQIGSSGNGARIGSSGYGAQIGSSGNGAQIGSSGNDARIGSSGNGAQIGSSGNGAQIGSSGYGARIESAGEHGVISSAGYAAVAKGATGTWISLAEYGPDGKCVGFATGQIGQDGLAPDTWYRADGGKLVEA